MKKRLFISAVLFFSLFCAFAQESDDLDSLFDFSEDVDAPVITEPAQAAANVPDWVNRIKLSGNFNGKVGISGTYENGGVDFGGALAFKNSLYMNVYANDYFQLHSCFYTSLDNGFSFDLYSCYFDYLWLKNIFISAGKFDINWGYTRLFSDKDYYYTGSEFGPQYCSIVSDSSNYVLCKCCIPWATGTFTVVPMCPFSAVKSGSPSYKDFDYAFSLENIFGHTCANLFGRINDISGPYGVQANLGLELKRTIMGFDVYAQANSCILDFTQLGSRAGYDYVAGTAGFYRLWDSSEPHFGINAEYQVVWQEDNTHEFKHRIVLEGGIKRLGPKKNNKIGVIWRHNFTEQCGRVELAYIISGIFPYADWTNGCYVNYTQNNKVKVQLATTISMNVDY